MRRVNTDKRDIARRYPLRYRHPPTNPVAPIEPISKCTSNETRQNNILDSAKWAGIVLYVRNKSCTRNFVAAIDSRGDGEVAAFPGSFFDASHSLNHQKNSFVFCYNVNKAPEECELGE